MKLRKKSFVSFACALALAGNSVCVLAQDKAQNKSNTQTQSQVQRKVVLTTPDGQTQEFNVEGDGTVFVGPDGKKAQVRFSSGQDGLTLNAQGHVTAHSVDGQNVTFVSAGNGQDFTYNFVSSEMSFDNKLVKGAPFTADVENESIKTLADGNRIIHKNSGSIARDGEGRTRRENTINVVGSFTGSEPLKTVTIHDPVAGTMFMLEPHNRVARKMPGIRSLAPQIRSDAAWVPRTANISAGVLRGGPVKRVNPLYPPVAKAAKATGPVQVQITVSEEGKVVDAMAISGHPLLRDAAVEAARQWEFKPTEASGTPVKVQSTLTFNFTLSKGEENSAAIQSGGQNQMLPSRVRMPDFNSNTESLGKQMVEGIEAEGKRTVTTIPAGAIGNERSIEIVSETWYSPELQLTIMSKRMDPTSGETTYRLTNIRRGEPDASLFQVPSDYTIKEGGFGAEYRVGAGIGVGTGVEVGPVKRRSPNQ